MYARVTGPHTSIPSQRRWLACVSAKWVKLSHTVSSYGAEVIVEVSWESAPTGVGLGMMNERRYSLGQRE